jgi:hypothetical protein
MWASALIGLSTGAGQKLAEPLNDCLRVPPRIHTFDQEPPLAMPTKFSSQVSAG